MSHWHCGGRTSATSSMDQLECALLAAPVLVWISRRACVDSCGGLQTSWPRAATRLALPPTIPALPHHLKPAHAETCCTVPHRVQHTAA